MNTKLMSKKEILRRIKKIGENKAVRVGMVVLSVLIVVLISVYFDLTEAQAFIRANRPQAALISIGIYFLLGFTFLPASPLTLFLSVFMGPWNAVAIAVIGNTLAALLEYQIGYTMGDLVDFEDKKKRLPLGLDELPITSPLLLMAGRMLPLGKRAFSVVCGAYQVPIGKYIWTTVLMYVIDATFVAFIGAGIVRLF